MDVVREYIKELRIRNLGGVVYNLNRLGVPRPASGNLLIRRMRRVAAHVADGHADDAVELIEGTLHGPEAATGEGGGGEPALRGSPLVTETRHAARAWYHQGCGERYHKYLGAEGHNHHSGVKSIPRGRLEPHGQCETPTQLLTRRTHAGSHDARVHGLLNGGLDRGSVDEIRRIGAHVWRVEPQHCPVRQLQRRLEPGIHVRAPRANEP